MLSNMAKILRDRRGRPATSVSASEAKNVGFIMAAASEGHLVALTHYGKVRAVVIPIQDYEEMIEGEPDLGQLGREFEALYAGMQTPAVKAATAAAFTLDAKEIGRLAAAGPARARQRRKSA